MAKVKKLAVLSFAKFQAIVLGFAGLLAGIVYSFGGLIIDTLVSIGWVTTTETPGLSYGTVLAFGALVGMPVIFAAFGFAVGLVEAVVFNIISKWVRAIDIDFEEK
jgi:hypothetical protein